jgi:hypothetical protein
MTVAGVTSLSTIDLIRKRAPNKDKDVVDGLNWLAANFSVGENPKAPSDILKMMHYYYLYGLDRACTSFGTEVLGKHHWYAEGAQFLLGCQSSDGSWTGAGGGGGNWGGGPMQWDIWNTCFAILFLRRGEGPTKVNTGEGAPR